MEIIPIPPALVWSAQFGAVEFGVISHLKSSPPPAQFKTPNLARYNLKCVFFPTPSFIPFPCPSLSPVSFSRAEQIQVDMGNEA